MSLRTVRYCIHYTRIVIAAAAVRILFGAAPPPERGRYIAVRWRLERGDSGAVVVGGFVGRLVGHHQHTNIATFCWRYYCLPRIIRMLRQDFVMLVVVKLWQRFTKTHIVLPKTAQRAKRPVMSVAGGKR